MAMPTRLAVLLQTRKSALAGAAANAVPTPAQAASAQARRAAHRHPPVVVARLMPGGCNGRNGSRFVDENGAEIVDVGGSRPRRQEIAETAEKAGRIVVGKKGGRIEAAASRPRERGFVDQGAGGIVRAADAAIRAVGIARERRNSG